MASVDTALFKKEIRRNERRRQERKRSERYFEKSKENLDETGSVDSSRSSDDSNDSNFTVPSTHRTVRRTSPHPALQNIFSPKLSQALDPQVSDRAATMIIAETAHSLGLQSQNLTLNRENIRKTRRQHREIAATTHQSTFSASTGHFEIVHWDSKLLPGLVGKRKVDRLAIIASCSNGSAQLLGVPILQSGEGKSQARAVYEAFQSWNIAANVQGMCFDTTASNTGSNEGACVHLEKLLGRDLLHIACRHHILELLPATAFKKVMGETSNPEVPLFKRFQAQWEHLDTQSYEDYSTDETVFHALCDERETLVIFLHTALEENQPRDDYREILEITAIFLGSPPPRGAHFMSPGPMHHARWMSKVIYSLKVWLFRKQFRMTPREEKGLRDLSIFFVRFYVKAWTCAPSATKAPQNDLILLQSLVSCEKIHPEISASTSKNWHLTFGTFLKN